MKRRKFIKTVGALGVSLSVSNLSTASAASGSFGSSTNNDIHDVVVIGAGLSGLVAAHELNKAGHTIKIVDAKTRVGGRTQNQISSNGVIIDAGGQWIGPTQTEIHKLASELDVKTFNTWNSGTRLVLVNGEVFPEPAKPVATADYTQTVNFIDQLAKTIPLDAPWNAPDAKALDAQLLDTWIKQITKTPDTLSQIQDGVASIMAPVSTPISVLWFLFYIHSAGDWETLQRIDNGAQQSRFVSGSQSLSHKIAAKLNENGEHVILGNPVVCIEQEPDYATVKLRYGELKARRVIVAMMPADANQIQFEPALPPKRLQLNSKWVAASGMKVHLVYPTPFWRELGFSGIAYTDTGAASIFDNSPDNSPYGVLVVFAEPEMLPTDINLRKTEIINVLYSLFDEQALNPIDYLEKDWSKEIYNAGCESPLPPNVLTTHGDSIREPVGLVHWAGTETAIQWNGYMEGAVRAGKRAAQEVMALL